jgi:hypothetical protein
MANHEKIDPVGERYFAPLRASEIVADVLFYLSAVLSLLALFVEKPSYPIAYSVVQIAFVLAVIALFVANLLIRLYFSPRAQKKRYEDFLSNAYCTALSHRQTTKYYNNSATTVPSRIAAQVLENSFYSRDTASSMATEERLKIAGYALVWFIAVLNRSTDLSTIGVAAQIVFSEQVISRWLRIEWLRLKCEALFDELFQLMKNGTNLEVASVKVLGEYEIVKATAVITLSTRLFERNEERTTREWGEIRKTLGI